MSSPMVTYSNIDNIGVITMDRGKANAYDYEFVTQFATALALAESDRSTNVVILKSALERFFCAGADINAFQQNSTADNQLMVDQARSNMHAIEQSRKIFIAQIDGHALGGGLEIAMACDLRFASEGRYWLGLPEIKLGLIPGNGGTQRLVRLVGLSKAIEILASGESFTAQQAFEWGVVNRLLPKTEAAASTLEYATLIANNPPLAVAATKKALRQGVEHTLAQGLKIEQQLADGLYDTADAKEGFAAFVEQRTPQFTGR